MRLTLVVARYLPHLGGIEIHVSEIARRAADAGWQVTIATLADQPGLAEHEVVDGITIRRFAARVHMAGHDVWSPQLWRFVQEGADEADVIHVHNYHAPVVLPALNASRARVVFTPHYLGVGPAVQERAQHWAYRQLTRRVLARSRPAIIHVSQTEAAEFRDDLGASVASSVHVIPNGVRVDDLVRAMPLPKTGRLLLLASRLEAYKQPDLVIRALAECPSDTHLAIAGDGPERDNLSRLADQLGVGSQVQMLGRLSWADLTSWYRTADVFLSLSRRECYGMSVAEALAAGVGVVASDIPAHREVVGQSGHPLDTLLPVDSSPKEISAAISRAFGYRCGPGTRPTPTWDDMVREVLKVYTDPV